MLELLLAFGVEEFAVGVDDGEGGNAFGDGDVVLLRDIDVLVHVTDVDVDEDEVFGEEFGVGALVIVDVEELAVAAPVAAEVEEDALVFAAGLGESGGDVGGGVGGLGVEVLVDLVDDLRGGLSCGATARISEKCRRAGGGACSGDFVIIDWTLFEFIETRHAATFAVAKVTQMMMHEECGTTQNYLVADAGDLLADLRLAWERFVVEKRISPLRCSR